MEKIFILIDGKKYGPYHFSQIQSWIGEGRIDKNTMCWYSGLSEWKPLGEVFPQFFQTASPPPPVVPQGNSETQKSGKGCCVGCFIAFVVLLIILAIAAFFAYKYGKGYYYQFKKEYRYNSFNLNTPYKKSYNFANIFYG